MTPTETAALLRSYNEWRRGWKLVPIEPTEEMMMRDSSCQKHAHDDQSCVHRTNRRWIWKTMLAAATEAKPCL